MITLSNVSKTYHLTPPRRRLPFASRPSERAARTIEALKNVDLHVPAGSIHGVI